jgi:hypothetical protein
VVFGPSIDDEALFRRQDRGIDRSDVAIETGFTDIEGRLQPLHKRREFGEFERGAQRRGDRAKNKAGVIGNQHFGPVQHMQHDPIARPDAARRHPARQALRLGSEPFVTPRLVVEDECCAFRTRLRLMDQRVDWRHFHG